MNNPNPENPAEESTAEPQPLDSRRRLRELLSVPERDRSDEQWDEIIELEIQLAPGNRLSANEFPGQAPRHGGHGQGKPQPGSGGGQPKKQHRPRVKSNRRPRQNKPGGGAGGGAGGGSPAA